MVWRLVTWKIDGSFRFVMIRVFDGGVGGWNGGTALRSMERGVREREECLDELEPLSDMLTMVCDLGLVLRWCFDDVGSRLYNAGEEVETSGVYDSGR